MRLNIDVDPHLVGLDVIKHRLQNPGPVLDRIADDLQEANAQRFVRVRFKPLTKEHAAAKARAGLSTRPLAGGELERSVLGRGKYAVRKVTADSVSVGTKNPVANLHKAGTKNMPKRAPVVSPSRQVRAQLAERIRRHVMGEP